MKRIGQGGSAKAWLVESAGEKQAVCKVVDLSKTDDDDAGAFKEATLLASLHHPYIVRYRDSFCTDGIVCLIMDFCDAGELAKQIRRTRRKHEKLPEKLVLRWFTQAMLALKYVHDKHIVHRDLKPGNLFLTKRGSIQLGDFGIATSSTSDSTIKNGTPYYISREVWEGEPFTTSSDVWSMGCILFEICALQVPFPGNSAPEIAKRICQGSMPSFPDCYSDFLRKLCLQLLERNPENRPSAGDVLRLPEIWAVREQLLQEQALLQEEQPEWNLDPGFGGLQPPRSGRFEVGDLVEYYSLTNCQWLPAAVISTADLGEFPVQIDLKPGVWISFEEQSSRMRHRKEDVSFDDSDPSEPQSVSDDASTEAPGNELEPAVALATSTTSTTDEVEFIAELKKHDLPEGLDIRNIGRSCRTSAA